MKFAIRDLILLTVIVGLGVGWWLDHQRLVNRPAPALPVIAEHFELVPSGEKNDRPFLFNPRTGEVWKRRDSPNSSPSDWVPYTAARGAN